MNASGIFQVLTYKAMNNAAKVSCPLFIVAPEDDNLCSLWAAVDVAEKAQNGEIFKLPGGVFASTTLATRASIDAPPRVQPVISTSTLPLPIMKSPFLPSYSFSKKLYLCRLIYLPSDCVELESSIPRPPEVRVKANVNTYLFLCVRLLAGTTENNRQRK